MGLTQIPQQEEIPAYPFSWLHVKPQLSLARPLDILNTHTMSWAQLDHTTFNSHAIYTMFTQKFTCPFPEKHGGLPPPITFLWPSLVVWPTQEKGTHAESPQHSGSMKSSLWFLLDVFLNHLCRVLSHGDILCVWKMLCLDSSEFWTHLGLLAMLLWLLFYQPTPKLLSLVHFSDILTM